MRRPTRLPFDGTPPDVNPGDLVEIRDASGEWHLTIARGAPSYADWDALGGRCHLTVPVDMRDGSVVNWPAEDVRPAPDPEEKTDA